MKKFFLSVALLAGAALSFTACNNGAYDMDPDTNNSNVTNPFNNGTNNGGTNVGIGTIQFKANGVLKTFNASGGSGSLLGITSISAATGTSLPFEQILITMESYTGAGTYEDADGSTVYFQYGKLLNQGGSTEFFYGGPVSTMNAKVVVSSDGGGVIKGTFSGKIWQGANDTLQITEGQFNVNKL